MKNTHNSFTKLVQKLSFVVALGFLASSTAMATEQAPDPEKMKKLKAIMMHQVGMMKPELQKKVKALSPKTQKSLMKILSQHTRYSDRITLRQVMHEVLSDYQSLIAGVMTDNPEQAAASARRLANHRIPAGGLLPYLGLENINDGQLAVLETFNDSVEGEALKLATAADAGDMGKAAIHLGKISSGCVACHQVFRSKPGESDLLR